MKLKVHRVTIILDLEKDTFMQNFNNCLRTPEDRRMFVQFCVLSGCDFLESLPKFGIVVCSVCLIPWIPRNVHRPHKKLLSNTAIRRGMKE